MNAEFLLRHFDRISEASGAVPRLRQFILNLAVRGKLVEQDGNDEPAPQLLKRIHSDKARLAKAGATRKEKPLPALPPDEPYQLPPLWCWTQLAAIGLLNPRNNAHDELQASFVPMPMISAEYGITNKHEVRAWGDIKSGYTHFAEGDVGLAKITPCFENGKSTVFRGLTSGIGAGTTELHIIRPILVLGEYILVFLKSPHFIDSGIPRMTGTAGQKRVPTEYFSYSPFPLPPLAEQHRIVAKVKELLELCDRLEEARKESQARRDRLNAACHHHLSNSADGDERRERARFFIDRLSCLTVSLAQVKELRRTILTLAIRGQLVPQDPNDEPASRLLPIITAEILRMQELKRIRVQRPAPPAGGFESQTVIPPTWVHVYLQDLAYQITDGTHLTPKYVESGKPFLSAQNIKPFRFLPEKHRFVSEEDFDAYRANRRPECGDVLLTRVGAGIGEAAVLDSEFEFAFYVSLCLIKIPTRLVNPYFLVLWLNSPEGRASSTVRTYGKSASQGNLNLSLIRTFKIPLPPLAEQTRIVTRVHELMALCDRLEGHLASIELEGNKLLEAALHSSLSPLDAEALDSSSFAVTKAISYES